jgi:hypothetical protein
MARLFLVLTTVIAVGAASSAALVGAVAAGPARAHSALLADDDSSKSTAVAAPGKSGGTIDGLVTAIDYRSSTMSVDAGARKVDVMILPSTNIQGPKNGFRTIADIQKGSHVRVLLSQRAGLFTAQIITLR